jgi:hypothetical protein
LLSHPLACLSLALPSPGAAAEWWKSIMSCLCCPGSDKGQVILVSKQGRSWPEVDRE